VSPAFAQAAPKVDQQAQVGTQLEAGAKKAELGKADPRLVVAQMIKTLLTLTGIFFIILVLMAGYWRVTAHGEEEKIKKSNETIMGAVIGRVIIMLAYAITDFVGRRVQNAVQGKPVYQTDDQGLPNSQWSIPLFDKSATPSL
jgi:uncharacterized membrane protein YjfL (UPF0719 family)